MEGEEPTQATQNVLDPRRLGKQNSGFSDEDISDIVCVLYPHSEAARQEVQRLAQENSPFIIGRDEADGVEPNYDLEDHASRFESHPASHGNHALILRLSSRVKNAAAGFAFGRNAARCDVVFTHDPYRRVSNIHFRIYVNEYGNVMVEDQSTNGTFVDKQLLASHAPDKSKVPTTKWVLSSGSIISIYLHQQSRDLNFLVRIPRRDDDYAQAYLRKVEEYFTLHGLQARNETIGVGPGGHVDLFRNPGQARIESPEAQFRSPSKRRDKSNPLGREWNGSGKYNRLGMIGKGAFAVVYKVTSKYDGKPYAAKELEKRKFIKNGVLDQKVENEMKIMKRVNHPNIVQYHENFDWDGRLLIIIMEFVPGGDLGKLIADDGPLPEDMVQAMSRQLVNALAYLHTNNITHRDVKPDNILISSHDPLEVKLTDFGLSKVVETEQTFLRTFCGTLLYCAPEVYTEYVEYDDNGFRSRGKKMRRLPGQRYNHAVDIWSLGGVLFYSSTGQPPYPTKNVSPSELLHRIMTTDLDTRPLGQMGISNIGIDFLHGMLQRRPENRATLDELDAHPWLGGVGSTIAASQSYDVITDDEELDAQPYRQTDFEEDRVSDSMGEESEKENGTFAQGNPGPRLFGEVGASAIGSSGVIPEDFLNLPAGPDTSMDQTEILDSHEGPDEYDSRGSGVSASKISQVPYFQTTVSIAQNQSADQLQSLVEDVASQSLGDHGATKQNLAPVPPHLSTRSLDFNSSKRKPPSNDTSEEFDDENAPPEKPGFKRLKSEGTLDGPADVLEEYKLLARVPPIRRLVSGRQTDHPVRKVTFWEQDRATWHLQYPEMTQLQHDAFTQAAREKGEEFAPGKSPLWALAMKYFPPTAAQNFALTNNMPDTAMTNGAVEFPATAAPVESDDIPDTAPTDTRIVPVQMDGAANRALGMLESHPDSCLSITFPITDSFVSFGRGPENTQVFEPKSELRVPKYAFKIVLWKDGYDLSRDPSKTSPPWQPGSPEDPGMYSFWISTKASVGIHINGYVLPSSDTKNPSSPSQYWTRLYDGDELLIWGNPDPARLSHQTKLIFRCLWGASIEPRGEDKKLELADPATAEKLDNACARTEKRVREAIEKRRKAGEIRAEDRERERLVERERERSRIFDIKRQEAIDFLSARHMLNSRRESPASMPPTTFAGRTQTGRPSPERNPSRLAR